MSQANSSMRTVLRATIHEHRIPTAASGPYICVEGPDQCLWFCESLTGKIGRFDPTTTTFKEFALPDNRSTPIGLVLGPDGNLWFSEKKGHKIGRITPAGVITEFPLPTPNAAPDGMIVGPDDAIWFSESDVDQVGRITTTGEVHEFAAGITKGSKPLSLTVRDGLLWFSEASGNRIASMSADGKTVREYATPSVDSQPRATCTHPAGGVWFVETGANALGRIDAHGVIREFPVPTPNASLRGVTVGPDNNLLWYTANFANQIGCMTPDGEVLGEFPIPTAASGPRCITAFSNGRLYFTQYDASSIGEVVVENRSG